MLIMSFHQVTYALETGLDLFFGMSTLHRVITLRTSNENYQLFKIQLFFKLSSTLRLLILSTKIWKKYNNWDYAYSLVDRFND